jgi:hypothetical protein
VTIKTIILFSSLCLNVAFVTFYALGTISDRPQILPNNIPEDRAKTEIPTLSSIEDCILKNIPRDSNGTTYLQIKGTCTQKFIQESERFSEDIDLRNISDASLSFRFRSTTEIVSGNQSGIVAAVVLKNNSSRRIIQMLVRFTNKETGASDDVRFTAINGLVGPNSSGELVANPPRALASSEDKFVKDLISEFWVKHHWNLLWVSGY